MSIDHNPRTRALAIQFVRDCLAAGDLNAGFEASAQVFVLLGQLIAKDEYVDVEDLLAMMLVDAKERVDARQLVGAALAAAKDGA